MARRALPSLVELEAMCQAQLRQEWTRLYGAPAPTLSIDLIRMGVAWRLQERRLGGLDRPARDILRLSNNDISRSTSRPQRKLTPGTKLVRDWHGEGHSVTVLDNGFEYAGKHWASLTAIARHITGTKWSGPRFFGLTGVAS